MTENKRFYLDESGINDREYEFSVLGEDELVDIINELNDENKVLKATNGEMEDYLARIEEEIQQFKKENKQLKQELQKIYEIATIVRSIKND